MRKNLARLETLIGKMLILGVTIAGSIVALGGVLYLLRYGNAQVHYGVFTGEPTDLRTIGGVLTDALHMSSRAIIQSGLLVLVALQVIRVAITAWLFEVKHDNPYVYITLLVLAILGYGLFGQVWRNRICIVLSR